MIYLLQIAQFALTVVWWIIVVQAILSWLIAFNVINTYNQGVRAFLNALDRITEPMYRPIRRVLPDFGAIDFSPLVVLLIIYILRAIVIPQIAASLIAPATTASAPGEFSTSMTRSTAMACAAYADRALDEQHHSFVF